MVSFGSVRERQLRVSKGAYNKTIIKRIFGIFLAVISSLLIIYLCFAFTLMRFLPTSDFKMIPVKNITYSGGIVPVGNDIVVDLSGEKHGKNFIDRVKQTFVPTKQTAVVKVVAGPNGKLEWNKPNIISVNKKVLPISMPLDNNGNLPFDEKDPYLRDEYIVTCVSGDCGEGFSTIISSDSILGDPLLHYENVN